MSDTKDDGVLGEATIMRGIEKAFTSLSPETRERLIKAVAEYDREQAGPTASTMEAQRNE